MKHFSPLTREALGWYVYLLIDSRTDEAFYVGKGRGNRAFAHAADAVDSSDHPGVQSAKAARIREILRCGHEVRVDVLRHGVSSEKQAYEVESAAIDLLNRVRPGSLLNVVLGHHHAQHGLMAATELEVVYAAPEAPPITVPVMLVSLNRMWTPDMSADALYEATSGWWLAGVKRGTVEYVFGVHNGVVRSIYAPTSWRARQKGDRDWQDDLGKRPRWGFEGREAPEMSSYLRTSVRRLITTTQWSHLYAAPEPVAAEQPAA